MKATPSHPAMWQPPSVRSASLLVSSSVSIVFCVTVDTPIEALPFHSPYFAITFYPVDQSRLVVLTIAGLAHVIAQTDDFAIAVSNNFWEALVRPVRMSVDAAISPVVGTGKVLDVGRFMRIA
ncbi:hypothetical protein EDB92DRAFT_1953430 [Lactarius akahatsu]|uniref:Uncharacterized protein n=1 Tax=Lactarius akahatsu TaxID=416441 RepID=A0AAD4L5H4_9AGAM|nr:hypothetical protein EDB92DRAFT_1953430 [Lactarius akahatsu]